MSKKNFLNVVMFSFFCLLNSSILQAVPVYDPIIYTVDGTTKIAKDSFDISETPSLYIKLPFTGNSNNGFWWYIPGNTSNNDANYFFTEIHSGNLPYYKDFNDITFYSNDDLKNPYTWNQIVKIGTWTLVEDSNKGKNSSSAETNFTITPEPISSTLFLIGAGFLAFSQYKKRNK